MKDFMIMNELPNKTIMAWMSKDIDHDLNRDGKLDKDDELLFLESLDHGFFETVGECCKDTCNLKH
jgi:hypothetical protein